MIVLLMVVAILSLYAVYRSIDVRPPVWPNGTVDPELTAMAQVALGDRLAQVRNQDGFLFVVSPRCRIAGMARCRSRKGIEDQLRNWEQYLQSYPYQYPVGVY